HALQADFVVGERAGLRRVERGDRLASGRHETARLAVVLVDRDQRVVQRRPYALQVGRRLPPIGELEGKDERLVGLVVLAGDQRERRDELLQLGDAVDRLLHVERRHVRTVEGDGRVGAPVVKEQREVEVVVCQAPRRDAESGGRVLDAL